MSGYTSSLTHVARTALAGVVIGLGALAAAGQANAQPVVPPLPTPVPGETPPPGQPVMDVPGAEPGRRACAAADRGAGRAGGSRAQYGQGSSPGPLGFLRDAWHQAQDPYGVKPGAPGQVPAATPPPPGAGPAPQLPPGYQSLTDPASSGPPPGGWKLCRRTASAGGVLLAQRATAARVLRRASRPGCDCPLLTRLRYRRAGRFHRRPSQACYASAGMTSRSNSSMPVRS